jgi:glycogen debranching enzyme
LRAYSYSKVAKQKVIDDLARFAEVLEKQNLAYVPEIFEAETLRGDGCISQAWSVGCLLEVYAELKK